MWLRSAHRGKAEDKPRLLQAIEQYPDTHELVICTTRACTRTTRTWAHTRSAHAPRYLTHELATINVSEQPNNDRLQVFRYAYFAAQYNPLQHATTRPTNRPSTCLGCASGYERRITVSMGIGCGTGV